ncbi:MAG: 23S rRNA (adenine(2503)-C(2))-methyltransferase RlmN, partial [Spirochaetaceae bacterium]|nr:23S rRNA (adenine(2503)-C(2))-methyltransferase RlmN [Spirochaetaceae bacterium]
GEIVMSKQILFGKTLEELKIITADLGLPAFAGRQLAEWLYRHRAASFDDMTNLSRAARSRLAENFDIGISKPTSVAVSTDGTKKYLFSSGMRSVETAWIPEEKRGTLCVSTQIGCRRGCLFCMTARQGFQGNLSAGEILNQYRSLPEADDVTHFVFMGMGEPLDNLKAVLSTLEILTSDWGFGFSPKKVTVSTIGIIEGLDQLLEKSRCRLALSLHSPFPDERADLIPYERRYPVMQVLDLFRRAELGRRRLTIEYLMIDGLNDSARHSRELSRILEGLGARVNLIPYHPIPDFPGTPSPAGRIETFRDDLNHRGLIATIRRSRGLDIEAACGLLTTRHQDAGR